MKPVWGREKALSSSGLAGTKFVPTPFQDERLTSLILPTTRAPPGRVIFEIAGEGLREEIARDGPFIYQFMPHSSCN